MVVNRRINSLFASRARRPAPGYAVGVMWDGRIVHASGYGMADLEFRAPITPATGFHVASLSKQFTAFAVLLLAADGKLSLDDRVRRYVPEMPACGARITLRHLLHHTSGLRDQSPLLKLAGWRPMDERTEGDVLDLVQRQRRLNFQPGEDFAYCNTGYTLLAIIVRRVSDSPLRVFAEKRIFKPLGMTATRFRDDHTELVSGRAKAYKREARPFQFWVPNFDLAGSTGLHTTVGDLLRWARNLLHPWVGGADVVQALLSPGRLNDERSVAYGAGVEIGFHLGLPTVKHSGWDLGYEAHLAVYPTQRFAVAILGNLSPLQPWLKARRVAELCLAGRFPERPVATIKLPKAELSRKTGVYRHPRNGMVLWVTPSRGGLQISSGRALGAGSGVVLKALDSSTFRADDKTTTVVFDDTGLTMRAAIGVEQRFERAVRWVPRKAALKAYAATYLCPELDAHLTFSVAKSGLAAAQRKSLPRAVSPACKDTFTDDKATYAFTRGRGGKVEGVTLSFERVHHLRFNRL